MMYTTLEPIVSPVYASARISSYAYYYCVSKLPKIPTTILITNKNGTNNLKEYVTMW